MEVSAGPRGRLQVSSVGNAIGGSRSFDGLQYRGSREGGKQVLYISGTDNLGEVRIPGGGLAAGSVLYRIDLNPYNFKGKRLASFAPLFERFMFVKCEMRYIPACGTTQAGQFLAGFSYDPTDAMPNIDQAVAMPGSVEFSPWKPTSIHLRNYDSKVGDFFTSSGDLTKADLRLSTQGTFFMMPSIYMDATTNAIGRIECHWTVRFCMEALEQQPANPTAVELKGDWNGAGNSKTVNLFATCNSTWGTQSQGVIQNDGSGWKFQIDGQVIGFVSTNSLALTGGNTNLIVTASSWVVESTTNLTSTETSPCLARVTAIVTKGQSMPNIFFSGTGSPTFPSDGSGSGYQWAKVVWVAMPPIVSLSYQSFRERAFALDHRPGQSSSSGVHADDPIRSPPYQGRVRPFTPPPRELCGEGATCELREALTRADDDVDELVAEVAKLRRELALQRDKSPSRIIETYVRQDGSC